MIPKSGNRFSEKTMLHRMAIDEQKANGDHAI